MRPFSSGSRLRGLLMPCKSIPASPRYRGLASARQYHDGALSQGTAQPVIAHSQGKRCDETSRTHHHRRKMRTRFWLLQETPHHIGNKGHETYFSRPTPKRGMGEHGKLRRHETSHGSPCIPSSHRGVCHSGMKGG